MNFVFKKELPTTIEELNRFEHQDEDMVYNTVVTILYGMMAIILFSMFCSYTIDHLNIFEDQITKSLMVK